MKRKTALVIFTCIGLVLSAEINNISAVLDGIVSRGNIAYEQSQRTRIKECADSVATILSSYSMSDDAMKDYSVSLYKLYGNYHYECGLLDSAAIYYNKAKSIIDSNPNTDFHGNVLLLLREESQLYYRMADYDTAVKLMAIADDILEYDGLYDIGGDDWLIFKMTYAICLARIKDFDRALDMAKTTLDDAKNKSGLAYAKAERMYGKILLLAQADNIGALKAYKSYLDVQKKYAMANFAKMTASEREEYWHTLRPFIADCYQLEDADPAFLYDVTLFSKGLLLQLARTAGIGPASYTSLKTLEYKWSDIQKKLKKGQAAVEFVQYEKNGEQRMAALLLKQANPPRFIRLTNPTEVLALVEQSLLSTSRNDKDKMYGDKILQSIIWTDDLLKSLAGISRLYFAPDGYMHRIAIEYMPQVDDMEVYRLTSTRRLMEDVSSLQPNDSALLIGGINYDLDKTQVTPVLNDHRAYYNYKGMSFPRLRESSNEAKDVYCLRKNNADTLLLASMASESEFRKQAHNYSSILISTHGDFCSKNPIATDLKPVACDEGMSQNIIAFAGVNAYLRNKNFDATNTCDGLLSAKELASLDLSSCKLFTISACQSALGEITPDGVFGLQRGLKNAGVDAMILSLWNVNSDATAMMMRELYSNIDRNMSIRQAFNEARKALFEPDKSAVSEVKYVFDPATMSTVAVKSDTSVSYDTPQYTNAFVLIDALE